jgi:hypothetical protein
LLTLVWTKRMNGVGPSNTLMFPTICPGSAAIESTHSNAATIAINRAFIPHFCGSAGAKVKPIQYTWRIFGARLRGPFRSLLGHALNLSKAGWSWAASQLWIVKGGRSGLLTHTATTESISLYADEKLTTFMELERAVCFIY